MEEKQLKRFRRSQKRQRNKSKADDGENTNNCGEGRREGGVDEKAGPGRRPGSMLQTSPSPDTQVQSNLLESSHRKEVTSEPPAVAGPVGPAPAQEAGEAKVSLSNQPVKAKTESVGPEQVIEKVSAAAKEAVTVFHAEEKVVLPTLQEAAEIIVPKEEGRCYGNGWLVKRRRQGEAG